MAFGRKDPECPRCRELLSGAPAIKWANTRRNSDAQRLAEVRAHDCQTTGCGSFCTFGDN